MTTLRVIIKPPVSGRRGREVICHLDCCQMTSRKTSNWGHFYIYIYLVERVLPEYDNLGTLLNSNPATRALRVDTWSLSMGP